MTLHHLWLMLVQKLDPYEPINIVLDFNETCGINYPQVWCGALKVAIYDHSYGSWVLISSLSNLNESNSQPGPLSNEKLYQKTDTLMPLDENLAKFCDSSPSFP